MPTLYVVSYPNEGHVPYWSLHLARAFKILGWDAVILSGEKQHGHGFLTSQSEFPVLPANIREMPYPVGKNLLQRLDNRTSMFRSLSRTVAHAVSQGHAEPDLVLFPYVDNFLVRTAHPLSIWLAKMEFRYPWVGALMRPQETFDKVGPIRRLFTHRCQGLWVLEENFEWKTDAPEKKLMEWLPDFWAVSSETPTDSFLLSRLTEVRKTKKIVSLMGRINKRKGYETFMKLMQSPQSANLFFFMGGNLDHNDFSESEKAFIAKHSDGKSEKFWFRELPQEADYEAAFRLSDVIFAAYPNFPGSSATLSTAVAFDKPVVVSASAALMTKRTRDFGLGYVLDEKSIDSDSELWAFLHSPSSYFKRVGTPRFEEFRYRHSHANLVNHLADWLSRRNFPVKVPGSIKKAA